MKIAVIQASTQTNKNELIFEETKRAVAKHGYEVLNFGVTIEESELSYIQVSLAVGLLLNSGAVDFVVTGCSSGVGMSIACNTLPNVISGYLPTPTDAFLFGRINSGNCASLPLGLNFGWAGELNLRFTLEKLLKNRSILGILKNPPNERNVMQNFLKQSRVFHIMASFRF